MTPDMSITLYLNCSNVFNFGLGVPTAVDQPLLKQISGHFFFPMTLSVRDDPRCYIFNRLLLQGSLTTKLWWWSDLNHHQCCVLFMSNYRLLPSFVYRLRTPKHETAAAARNWKLASISLASTSKSAIEWKSEKNTPAKRNSSAKLQHGLDH